MSAYGPDSLYAQQRSQQQMQQSQPIQSKGKGPFTGGPQMGLGPSMGRMPQMMGQMGSRMMPGMRMGQQQQMPGNRMGGMFGAMGQALGGFQQQRQVGQNRQMPFQPRQDMQDMGGQVGMSNTRLPMQGSAPNDMNQQDPYQMDQQKQQMQMQKMMQMFGGGRRGGMGGFGGGIGPSFMQQGYQPQRYEQQQGPIDTQIGYGTSQE